MHTLIPPKIRVLANSRIALNRRCTDAPLPTQLTLYSTHTTRTSTFKQAVEVGKSLAHHVDCLIRSLIESQMNETELSARRQLRGDTSLFKSTRLRLEQDATT